ncbi:TRAP transporter small permease subunit [Jannaschia aquimarina]|uniref:TRAP transporter small permease protein n=1 Tax=Jannaschia aquimarina TaxID=935700 RepID=A0A0D1CT83_9RHOB|nr:TRAP transporter small permease [Jannaschia aquimarina]KIT17977.1 Tripartite ATP-independent periplasmic transporter, DctQ component [Jannaschia aquimarina]SNT04577.1 TRAP-type C4-dicarboxylate transport system, small permease component [Jannaschia aquimarina]
MAGAVLSKLRAANRAVALLVGLGLLATAMLTLLDIGLRQVGASFGGTDEISGYAMAIASGWAMGFALCELAHVRIDVLRTRLAARGRALLDILSMASLSGVLAAIAWRCWPVVERSLTNGSRANTPLETPLAWVQVPWMLGWLWFALTAWIVTVCALVLILRGDLEAAERAAGTVSEVDAAEVHS